MGTTSSDARAMVLEKPRTLVGRTLPLPEIGDDDAIVRVEACGLCGTDHEQYTGALAASFAFVPGHETVGVIESIGPEARAAWGVDVGDRVAVEVFRGPPRQGLRPMYGFIDVDVAPALWGGYATHQYLAPDTVLHRVPDGVDPVVATLFNPLGAGIRWGVTVPGTSAGDVVAVLGPGIRGLSALIAVRDAGAGFVMVTGCGPRDAPRLELASRLGADLVVDVADTDPARALRAATGGRLADVVVDVTATAPAALAQAVATARPGGTVVLAGTRGSDETPGFSPDVVVYKELRLLGALGVDSAAYRAALDLLADDRHGFADLPRRVADLGGIAELLLCMSGETGETPPVHGVLVP